MECVPLTEDLLAECDLVVVTSDHTCVDYAWVVEKANHVLDTRNATKRVETNRHKIKLL